MDPQAFAQFGFAALIAGYLVVYITRSLNGKLDRVAEATERNATATEALTRQIERLTDRRADSARE